MGVHPLSNFAIVGGPHGAPHCSYWMLLELFAPRQGPNSMGFYIVFFSTGAQGPQLPHRIAMAQFESSSQVMKFPHSVQS